jgi:hypothetical protein
MATDATVVADASGAEVVASVDTRGASREYIIADITRDDAWLSVRADEAVVLSEWR